MVCPIAIAILFWVGEVFHHTTPACLHSPLFASDLGLSYQLGAVIPAGCRSMNTTIGLSWSFLRVFLNRVNAERSPFLVVKKGSGRHVRSWGDVDVADTTPNLYR